MGSAVRTRPQGPPAAGPTPDGSPTWSASREQGFAGPQPSPRTDIPHREPQRGRRLQGIVVAGWPYDPPAPIMIRLAGRLPSSPEFAAGPKLGQVRITGVCPE